MATFILVPGAMHTAWCWHKIVGLLEQAGHYVIALDLPGTGENRSHPVHDLTLAIWADYVADQVRRAEGPVLLVGHSRGGHVIGEAAEQVSDQLAGLIYLAAVVSLPGMNLVGAIGADPTTVPPLDANGCLPVLPEDAASDFFYHQCSPEDQAEAYRRLYPEPFKPDGTAAGVTVERWGRIPRAYIECTEDRAVPLEIQRRMQAGAPFDHVVTLESDHSPFLSAPETLVDAMLAIAGRFAPADVAA